jgi:transposase
MRKGFDSLAARAQTVLGQDPFSGHVFCSRGRRGDLVKLLWWDGDGLCLFAKRLERGRFVWSRAEEGVVVLSRAQLTMLLERIDQESPTGKADATNDLVSRKSGGFESCSLHRRVRCEPD